jgi:hypothetical protein
MKTFILWLLLAGAPSIAVVAKEQSFIHTLITDLDQDIETLIAQLKTTGYTENKDTIFQQADVRVFIKAEKNTRPSAYIVELCGNKITGYTKLITSMESVLLVEDLKKQGYKKVGADKYRKGHITIDFFTDDTRLLLAKTYIHVSRKNGCHNDNLPSPLVPELKLRSSSVEEALTNLARNRNEVTLAAAKSAFVAVSENAADSMVAYMKPHQAFRVKYCHNQVQRFEIEVNAKEGNSLVTSLEKANFHTVKKEAAANNAYSCIYENEVYEVIVQYYGDKYGREFNENAYKIILLNKKTCS